jgi:FKBP-type peptidyl-prolyl cis-trans isomerase SlyD
MQITQDTVVSIHYTLTDDTGKTIDSSAGGEPLAYLHGNGNLIPGLERALEGRQAGDALNVKISPAEGYGEHDKSLIQQIPRRVLKGIDNIHVGMQLQAQSDQGSRAVTVTHVAGDMVTIDGNHPLAGQNLNFEVQIADVRAATEEELAHGHVHGPGGHHHG